MRPRILPDAIFFDVDGVLIDSLAIKGEALAYTFQDFPDSHQLVVDFHLANGGVTRSEKISRIYRRLSGVDPSTEEIERRSRVFGDAVEDRIIAAKEIPGASATLHSWSARCPLYAVSATPDRELKDVLAVRGMGAHFRGIYGWPPPKDEAIASILDLCEYNANRCVLVGDSKEDLIASCRTGVRFLHVGSPVAKVLPGSHQTIHDLHSFDTAIAITLAH